MSEDRSCGLFRSVCVAADKYLQVCRASTEHTIFSETLLMRVLLFYLSHTILLLFFFPPTFKQFVASLFSNGVGAARDLQLSVV